MSNNPAVRKIDRRLLQTGIPLIDRQHEEYADLVDRLLALITRGGVTRQALAEIRNAIVRYAMEHFDSEEYLMRLENYPDLKEHVAKHNCFREWTSNLTADLEETVDIETYAGTMGRWLIDWFADQVQIHDRKLAIFLTKVKPQ